MEKARFSHGGTETQGGWWNREETTKGTKHTKKESIRILINAATLIVSDLYFSAPLRLCVRLFFFRFPHSALQTAGLPRRFAPRNDKKTSEN